MSALSAIRLLALALPVAWLEGPGAYFTAEDWTLVRQAVRSVVESGESNSVQRWSNSANDHSGVVSSLKAFESKDGRPCHVVQLENHGKGLESSMRYTLCRDEAGVWRDMDSGVPFTEVASAGRKR